MSSVVVGTAGHVDHGKTALVRALTGVDTDRWEEERRRGITIDLGFAPLPLSETGVEVSVVDVPGHEDLVKNMLAGATGVDMLLLVVAADEGPMPQTTEHLWIARYLGLERGVLAITKTDLADAAWVDLVVESAAAELRRVLGRDDWAVVPVSVVTGEGVNDVREAIAALVRQQPRARSGDDLFRLPVDRSFIVRGVGTVVTGTVWGGEVSVGDEVLVMPTARRARVRGMQVHGGEVPSATVGQRAALALAGLERDEVSRGDVLCGTEVWRASDVLDVQLRVSPDAARPLQHWQRLRFHLGTAETLGRVVLYESDFVRPGGEAYAQLRLERPVVARHADRFVIRFYSPVTTIGGGVVIDPWATRRGRGQRSVPARLRALAARNAAARVEAAIESRADGTSASELAILAGIAPRPLETLLSMLEAESRVIRLNERWHGSGALDAARERAMEAVSAAHARDLSARGVDLEELRRAVGGPADVVNEALRQLGAEGRLRVDGSVAAVADHVPSLSPRQQELAAAAGAAIREGGLTPPTVGDLAGALGVGPRDLIPVLEFLARQGEVVGVGSELFFASEELEEARRRVAERLRAGPARAGELRAELGMSRRYAIPLLEHLDASGLTRRTAAGRVLNRAD